MEVVDPILIYYDNFNNIHLAPNLVLNARTKHIKVHYNFIKQHVIVGDVDLVVKSNYNTFRHISRWPTFSQGYED